MEETLTRIPKIISSTETLEKSLTRKTMPEAATSFLRRVRRKTEEFAETQKSNEGFEEQEEAVGKKIMALQKIVPGGEDLGVDELFEETAGYILSLQCQIKAIRVLTGFLQGLEKENMKLGG